VVTTIQKILFWTGTLLLLLNLGGLFMHLRNGAIYQQASVTLSTYITLSPEQVFSVIEQYPINDRKNYLVRLTNAVHNGVVHYWEDDAIDEYNIRVPVYENYLLYAASYIYPSRFRKYEFMDYRKAVERGIGLCSQYSLIIAQVLKKRRIPAKIILLDGHVVATAQADPASDQWWILDADYGVVVPHDVRAIARNPALALPNYAARGYSVESSDISRLLKKGFQVVDGARGYAPILYWVEYASYVLIWLIPAALLMPMICGSLTRALRASDCSRDSADWRTPESAGLTAGPGSAAAAWNTAVVPGNSGARRL
jgi:hypothetical protein